jgi:hypothetical protein
VVIVVLRQPSSQQKLFAAAAALNVLGALLVCVALADGIMIHINMNLLIFKPVRY